MAITEYSTPVQNHLEQYIPLPLDQIYKAGQAIQQRGDAAEMAQDQVQTGLASMEAYAPGHRQFISKYVNDFRTQQKAIIDKYGGNTSDPEYIRESRRVNLQFAADPRLKVIQQANDLYKTKEKVKTELQSKGIKFLDTNNSFTGIDSNGNLSADVGQVKAVNYDAIINDRIKMAASKMEQRGRLKSNQWNIAGTNKALKQQIQSDPDLIDGVKYLMQQGLDQKQAMNTMGQYIDSVSKSMVSSDIDHFGELTAMDRYTMRRNAKLDGAAAQQAMPNLLPFTSERSPIVEGNANQSKLSSVDKILSNLNDAGGIKKSSDFSRIKDTPENRIRYANELKSGKYTIKQETAPGAMGVSMHIGSSIVAPNKGKYNPEEERILKEARNMLGDAAKYNGKYLSDKTVLSKYKDALSKQATAYNYIKPNNDDYTTALKNIHVGQAGENIGSEFTALKSDGTIDDGTKKGTNPLKDVKHFSFGGINPTPFGKYPNGTMKINAIDKDGNPIEILKPLDKYQQQMMYVPNRINQMLHSDKEFDEFKAPNGQILRIEKGIENGGLGVKASVKTEQGYVPINTDQLINSSMAGFYNMQHPYEKLK